MEIILVDPQSQSSGLITFQLSDRVQDLFQLASEELGYEANLMDLEYEGDVLSKTDQSLIVDLGISSGQEMIVRMDSVELARTKIMDIPLYPSLNSLYELMQLPCSSKCAEITDLFVTAQFDISHLLLYIGPTPYSGDHVRHAIRSGALVTVDCFLNLEFRGPCVTDILEQYVDAFEPICEADVKVIASLMVTNHTVTPLDLISKFLTKCKTSGLLTESSSRAVLKPAMCRITITNKNLMDLLMEFGGDPEDTLSQNENLMCLEMVKLCLNKGTTITDEQLSHLMSIDGIPVMRMLREEYPNINLNRDIPFGAGSVIPMYIAAADGLIELADFIFEIGGSVEDARSNPLHVASSTMVVWLLAHGADVNFVDESGETPLLAAAPSSRADNELIISTLLTNGADPNATSSYDGSTPLHLAACKFKTIKQLVVAGASLTAENDDGCTPLDVVESKLGKRYLENMLKAKK